MEITMKWWLSWSDKSKICYRGSPGGGWTWWLGGWPMGIFCINNRFGWNKGWPGGRCDHGLTKAGEFWEAYHRKDEDENRIDDDESNDDEDGVTKAEDLEGLAITRLKMRMTTMTRAKMMMMMARVWQKQEDLEGLAITSTPFLHCGDSQPRRQNKTKCSWYYHHWLSRQDVINFHLFKEWGWIKTKASRTKQWRQKTKQNIFRKLPRSFTKKKIQDRPL